MEETKPHPESWIANVGKRIEDCTEEELLEVINNSKVMNEKCSCDGIREHCSLCSKSVVCPVDPAEDNECISCQ